MFPFLLICLGLGIATFAGLALFLWRIDACRHDDPARAAAADAAGLDLEGNPQTVGGSGAGILPAAGGIHCDDADLPDVPQPPAAAGIRPGSPAAILSDPAARLAAAALLGLRPDQVAWEPELRTWYATQEGLAEMAGGLADRALCRRGGV